MDRHVVITGSMGVGKSTTAQAVVAVTGLAWRDSDADLEWHDLRLDATQPPESLAMTIVEALTG